MDVTRENTDLWLTLIAVICLFQAVELGWHASLALRQHLKPNDVVEWTSRPHGGYAVSQYTVSTLVWSAPAYLLVGVTALLILARRHGLRLGRVAFDTPKPRSKRRR